MMKRLLIAGLGLALSAGALGLAACAKTAEGADPLKDALRPEWIQIKGDHRSKEDGRLVVVIGENHASVQGQIDLAALLEQLLDTQQIQAILVEGSEGPIDVQELTSQLAENLSEADLSNYWRRQLEWGKIAGWEYVALTRPQTPAEGVEDMAAKYRYMIQETGGSEKALNRQAASWERGAQSLEQLVAALEQAGIAQAGTRSALQDYRRLAKEYAAAADRYNNANRPVTNKALERLATFEQLETALRETGLAELRSQKGGEELFLQRMHQLQLEDPAKFARLVELFEKSQALTEEAEEQPQELVTAAEALSRSHEKIQDAYFTLANRLRAEIQTQWKGENRPPQVQEALLRVESFFSEERKKAEAEQSAEARQDLVERDRAMAANTAQYLLSHPVERVALIVGFHHLEGVMAELQSQGVPYLAGSLVADKSEPWEVTAWERRTAQVRNVWPIDQMAKPSRLLDPVWKENQIHLVQGASRALQNEELFKESGKAFYASPYLAGPRVPRGAQVVEYGPMPGRPGEMFELWDRKISRAFVANLSDRYIEFVFGFHERDESGKKKYTFATRWGDLSIDDFRVKLPGKGRSRPSYVVAFNEPDFQAVAGILRSYRWHKLRLAGDGGGRGGGPPVRPVDPSPPDPPERKPNDKRSDKGDKKPPFWTSFGGAWDSGRPRIIRTNDPARARRNLTRLKDQKPLDPAEMQFFENPKDLSGAFFAQQDGTYAGMVILMARNSAEFREAVAQAADREKLINKQVVLITCGDLFPETTAMRENLLAAGVLMVWTPDRQLTPETGAKLKNQIEATLKKSAEAGNRPQDIDQLVNRAIEDLLESEPDNQELLILPESGSWAALPRGGTNREDLA